MAVTWNKTNFPGVRYYEHATRKHGVQKDKYFAIRFQACGKRREEGLGWASEGWSAAKAAQTVAELKKAATTGEGATSLAEKRQKAEEKRQAEAEAHAQAERDNVTFEHVFLDSYFPIAKKNKAQRSWQKEDQCYRLWIAPVLADKPLKDIAPIHLERIKKNMAEAGRAARSITYTLAVVRQVFNFARDHDLFAGQNPVTKIKKPSSDNRRVRFLSHEEADRLLAALAEKSPQVRDMALLSLHCGLRAGEIFSLTWGDVDMERGVLTLRDTKSGKTRAAILTDAAKAMLADRERRGPADLVFPSETGEKVGQVSQTFIKTVNAFGFNDGVTDARQKVVFHSLRHTFASWLAEAGTDLYTIQQLMGHQSFAMVQRYAHLSPDTLRRAVKGLEAGMDAAKARDKKVVRLGDQ
ncbi:tyrosine-type recombinase/integrase [Solidesulfovibrio alcoholivorans]|uniref:tyrosine-type recombinase/integrase n=1 Tax=Solidesulfovibrio alcoholivorans TaxID=81406 RepID=UPI00049531FC|nr:site-specific integrase [Solidesulfovibrio alcoholivorans]